VCGRFRLTTPGEDLAEAFDLDEAPVISPRGNIAPTEPVGIVRVDPQGVQREWTNARWGLIPHWSKTPPRSPLFDARAETASQKAAFSDAFRHRRCLVPADGFYEWKLTGKRKQPYLLQLPDGRPFAFAGLWDRWEQANRVVESCTILTTSPNDAVRPLHERMPVILQPSDYARWLAPAATIEDVQPLLVPFSGQLTVVATSPS
jgi:putative SOS response-associated peptidase YedK